MNRHDDVEVSKMSGTVSLSRRAFEKGVNDVLTLKPLRDVACKIVTGEVNTTVFGPNIQTYGKKSRAVSGKHSTGRNGKQSS